MKRCKWADDEELAKLDHVEICPKAIDLTHTIAERIGSDGGGALIIDYGLNGIVSDSLQVNFFWLLNFFLTGLKSFHPSSPKHHKPPTPPPPPPAPCQQQQ